MVELTHRNHFKFGFNGENFSFRQSAVDQWFVDYGPSDRLPFDFRRECVETAMLIGQKAKGQIWVLFSGGVDSEVVVRSFVLAKVPFRAAILRFKNNLNIHDIAYAVSACESLGVPYTFFDLDISPVLERAAF